MLNETARRVLLSATLATAFAAPLPASALPGLSSAEADIAHRSPRCERLADRLQRQRDDRTLNAQDFFRLRSRGC